jgi:hypothetical protein
MVDYKCKSYATVNRNGLTLLALHEDRRPIRGFKSVQGPNRCRFTVIFILLISSPIIQL